MGHHSLLLMRINAAIAVMLTLMLCGCGSPWGNDLDPNAIACQGYGYYPENPDFAQCMKYVEAARARRAGLTPKPVPPAPNITCQTSSSGTNCQTR
jgi:hypothetical protein